MKVYLEFEDGHNGPMLYTFADWDDALEKIGGTRSQVEQDEIHQAFLGDGPAEDGFEEPMGEWYDGGDKWTVINAGIARARAERWELVARAIEADEEAPL